MGLVRGWRFACGESSTDVRCCQWGGGGLTSTKMTPVPWRELLKEVNRGRSVNRALLHHQVRTRVELSGVVLDVGGGHRNTYLEHVDTVAVTRLVVIDLQATAIVDVVGSVTALPVRSDSFDAVLCFNLLEHVFDYESALSEMNRVMKPGAVMYGWVPFAYGVHGDPHDYWRYTPDTLSTLLSKAGFSSVVIVPCGDAFVAGFDMVRPTIVVKFLGSMIRVAAASAALAASWAARKFSRQFAENPDSAPLGIWFEAYRA